jgi:hypothetical protein
VVDYWLRADRTSHAAVKQLFDQILHSDFHFISISEPEAMGYQAENRKHFEM